MRRNLTLALVLCVVAAAFWFGAHPSHAQTGTNYLYGYAWSDTVGWICMGDATNCANANVYIGSDNATLSGYAWGSNVGWVSFNSADTGSCGSGGATINQFTDALSGWARALTTGSDGCISLSGSGYGVTLNGAHTYAWASDTLGWVDFAQVRAIFGGNISSSFNPNFVATPARVGKGGSTSLSWDASSQIPGGSCSGVTTPANNTPLSGSAVLANSGLGVSNIQSSTIFTLTCTDSTGKVYTKTAQVSLVPVFQEK